MSVRPFTTRASSAIDGISSRQGAQLFVQKLRKTVLPRNDDSFTEAPFMSLSSKSGARRLRPA